MHGTACREARISLRLAVFALIMMCLLISPLRIRANAAEGVSEERAVKDAVETFLHNFTEEALLYEERDQRTGTVSDPEVMIPPEAWERTYRFSKKDVTLAEMRENIAFAAKKADYFAAMRRMQDIYRENLRLAYTYQVLDIEDGTCHVTVTEAAGFRYTDSAMPSVNESIYSVDLIKLDGRWLVAAFTDGSGFDKKYLKQGSNFDVNAAMKELLKSIQTENCKLTNPYSGAMDWDWVPYNGANAAAYAYTYSRLQPEERYPDYYSPFFVNYAGEGGDCMNFASQCMWAGFGGSETASSISSRSQPMDTSGSYRWYGRAHGGKSPSNSWISCQSFRSYLTGTADASGSGGSDGGNDAGMYATVLSVSGGSPITGVTPEELVGAPVHVESSGKSYTHSIIITAAVGTRRDQIWFCGHTKNVTNVKLGDCYLSSGLKIYIPRYLRTGRSQANTIQPQRIPPIAAGETGILGAQTGGGQYRVWFQVTAPNGETVQMDAAGNTKISQAEYLFTEPGLYKTECFAMSSPDAQPVSAAYYIRCYQPPEVPDAEQPAEDIPADEAADGEPPAKPPEDAAGETGDPPVIDEFPDGI